MSRFACLAPARSLPMHDHQQRLLERLGLRSDCRYKTRRQSKRWSAEDQLVLAAMALERCYPPASPRLAAWARRTLAAARAETRAETRGRRGGQWISKEQRQSRALEAAAGPAFVRRHMGRRIRRTRRMEERQAAERAAVVGEAYRIHGAAERTTAVIVDRHFPQN